MRWLLVLGLVAGLLAGAGVPGSAQVADKVKAASERAYKDYVKHGLMLAAEGRDEAASQSFLKAIGVMPQNAEAHSLYGSSLARMGKLKEAEESLKKAVTLKPDFAEGWYYLGLFYQDRGKAAEAEDAFRKAKQYQK